MEERAKGKKKNKMNRIAVNQSYPSGNLSHKINSQENPDLETTEVFCLGALGIKSEDNGQSLSTTSSDEGAITISLRQNPGKKSLQSNIGEIFDLF